MQMKKLLKIRFFKLVIEERKIRRKYIGNYLDFSKPLKGNLENHGVEIEGYFPIQNLLKIFASKSSVVTAPVISPK